MKQGKNYQILIVLRRFLLPQLNRRFVIRLLVIAGASILLFLIFRPCFIVGSSMEPAYSDRQVILNFTLRYTFGPPDRGDVVAVSYFGNRFLLKRVIGVAGDIVEFRSGRLFINGKVQDEPYVKFPCDWNISPVTVKSGCCYIVGDNRDQPYFEHKQGQVDIGRIAGGPLW